MHSSYFKKRIITLATNTLNQWILDFEGNTNRIIQSIRQARIAGSNFRTGTQLEITGYGCKDHFLEPDTYHHSWQSLIRIISDPISKNMLLDIGMPVMHRNANYNCRVIALNGKILLIRPKVYGCQEGNYIEYRYFRPWRHGTVLDSFQIPPLLSERAPHYQKDCPFGNAIIRANDTEIGFEICQELWEGLTTSSYLYLDGAEIVCNASGSHHQLRKLEKRLDLINNLTSKMGGVYVYANQIGCDGDKLYYDGSSMVSMNGSVYCLADQFSMNEVTTVATTINLGQIEAHRSEYNRLSPGMADNQAQKFQRIIADISLCADSEGRSQGERLMLLTPPLKKISYHIPEEEIALGPACWLWDYLRRSGARGFFLPLSGGADSSSVSAIVSSMSHLLFQAVKNYKPEEKKGEELASYNNAIIIKDLCRVLGADNYDQLLSKIQRPQDITSRLFVTCYMGTVNSSKETRIRAVQLAKEIGSIHKDTSVDTMVQGMKKNFKQILGKEPKFEAFGGSKAEDLALQNIQARLRMVLGYMIAQLVPQSTQDLQNINGSKGKGFLLVLGSANIDQGLRGYMTKYDCSSADINPIGGINKLDLKRFIIWAADKFNHPSLKDVANATATAQLRPLKEDGKVAQSDEEEMGMTYQELNEFGQLRKVGKCGPVEMFDRLVLKWGKIHEPKVIAEKVKRFFKFYSINRHKMTTLTPSYHAERYGTSNDLFDLRPFLYKTDWKYQFKIIDEKVSQMKEVIPKI